MKINVDDPSQLLSHVLLGSREVCTAVRDSKEYKADKTIAATVLMNGVEVPAEILEAALKKLMDQVESHCREHYQADAFDAKVEEKANQLLQEHADNAIEKMQNLMMTLEDAESFLTPHWERKK